MPIKTKPIKTKLQRTDNCLIELTLYFNYLRQAFLKMSNNVESTIFTITFVVARHQIYHDVECQYVSTQERFEPPYSIPC